MVCLNKMADLNGFRLVLFRISDLVCAADVRAVREILPPHRATRLPGAPRAVAGLIDVRGELVPLVHGARLLGREESANGGPTLLLTVGSRSVALTVDEVLDLFSCSDGDLAHRRECRASIRDWFGQ